MLERDKRLVGWLGLGLGFLEKMTEVILHIYDVTNSGSEKTDNTIMQINKIFKDGIGLGGIFHSAIQVLVLPIVDLFMCNW